MKILLIIALILSIIAIGIAIFAYILPIPIIDDSAASENKTYSSNKIETIDKNTQDLKLRIENLEADNEELKDTIDNLNSKLSTIESKIGTLDTDTPNIIAYVNKKLKIIDGTTTTDVTQYVNNKLKLLPNDANLLAYITREIFNNTAFVNSIVTDETFKDTVSDASIQEFFKSNNTNTIHTIKANTIIVTNQLRPDGNDLNNTVDIQATRLLPVQSNKYTVDDNGFWVWYEDLGEATELLGYNSGLWGRFSWSPRSGDPPVASVVSVGLQKGIFGDDSKGVVWESYADFNFSVGELQNSDNLGNIRDLATNEVKKNSYLTAKVYQNIRRPQRIFDASQGNFLPQTSGSTNYYITTNSSNTRLPAAADEAYSRVMLENRDRRKLLND